MITATAIAQLMFSTMEGRSMREKAMPQNSRSTAQAMPMTAAPSNGSAPLLMPERSTTNTAAVPAASATEAAMAAGLPPKNPGSSAENAPAASSTRACDAIAATNTGEAPCPASASNPGRDAPGTMLRLPSEVHRIQAR